MIINPQKPLQKAIANFVHENLKKKENELGVVTIFSQKIT